LSAIRELQPIHSSQLQLHQNIFLNSSDPSRTVLPLPHSYLIFRQLKECAVLRRHTDKKELSTGMT
jgi:hypothetical protein